ncbi:murein biosynthesis integral membrane protein MurJ [Atopobium fossor]|uniref:murein biosynthesis integral membrane protein MurJ n=1 Tax=Atopobium fossor TaxID=39487 RepID=UPI00042914E6|nr:murein biosynthesis integral membrane protein MurJ [Atopobium fossor]
MYTPKHMKGVSVPKKASVSNSSSNSTAGIGRSAALMSGLVILSRITGFFRTWGQAYALGVTLVSSAYTVANNLPNQLYELVMGGMLITAFLPVYMSVKEKAGREGASKYASNLASLVVLLMGIVALLGFVFASQVIWTQSFSAKSDFDFDLTTLFFRFFVIEVVLYALSSILSGILNAEREYFWSNAAPIFNNFICTASFVLYAVLQSSHPNLALLCLAIGNPLGVAVQVVIQIPALRKMGVRIRPYVDLKDPSIKETLSIGIPSLVLTGCNFVTYSVQTSSVLSVIATGASIAYYARLWYTLPYAILAIPITTAMFTELSEAVAHHNMDQYKRGVAAGTSQILFFLIPFAMYLIVFSRPLSMLLGAGRFNPQDLVHVAEYLAALSVALPLYGVCTYLQKACSSLRKMGVLAWSSIVASAIQVAQCLLLTEQFGLLNVALSSLVFFVVVDVVTFWSLRKQLQGIGLTGIALSCVRSLVVGALGSAVGMAILLTASHMGFITGTVSALIVTVAGGLPALFLTFGLAIVFKFPEAHMIRTLLGRLIPSLRSSTE